MEVIYTPMSSRDTLLAGPQYRAWRMRVPFRFVLSISIGLLGALVVAALAPTPAQAQLALPGLKLDVSAAEIRRVGERDEFDGVFLPGAARIPYGNPVHDPLWRACDDLGLPVVVHTHFEGVGIAGPVTAAGYPDHYGEYHALCGSGMHGHFASILCHGILERFPRTGVMMMEGGLVGFVGFRRRDLAS